MNEIIFLSVLALVWIIFAVIQDLRKREIANWINFSLIVFALGFRFFYSLFTLDGFSFFYQGLIGLGIFFIIGNLLYYGRLFAGGDAKLMIALGAIIPFSSIFSLNLKIFMLFILIFLFVGAIYGLVVGLGLSFKNFKKFKKEFKFQLKKNKKRIYFVLLLGLVFMLIGFIDGLFLGLGVLIFILPYFYLYARAVDESCLVRKVKTSQLTEGDWLYKDIKVGKKIIKAKWEGLKKSEINQIKRKYKTIMIRYGMPFSPVFLISFLILLYFWKTGLWNSFW